jgi:hypothetical protein
LFFNQIPLYLAYPKNTTMLKIRLLFFSLVCLAVTAKAQTNIISVNPTAEQILLGNYNPNQYKPTVVLNTKQDIVPGILAEVSQDSLQSYIRKMATFHNRNTCADTLSPITGMGAARTWVHTMFTRFSAANQNRLIPSYLQFDQSISGCTMNRFKNIFAVLPGLDTTDKSVMIIEGHIDSRCEDNYDINCQAEGIEDNATGTALVMELARVMSKYAFNHTLVFIVTIGEEQGLYGANAFAQYCVNKGIKVKAVQNNDVIGGIYCGKTASPPTECVNPGDVDSTHVRIFSFGNYTSAHKAYARFSKLEYVEEAMPLEAVPMTVRIMVPEDRTGRGGDHIPFRQKSMTAVRFTASREHGNANPVSGYSDRQHSFRDTLGVDTNNDGVIDSFYISFSYLRRNAVVNGTALAMAAIGPKMPAFTVVNDSSGITLNVTAQQSYNKYKVNVRRNAGNYDLDLLYTFTGTSFKLPVTKKDSTYYISIASIDNNDIESLFTIEQMVKAAGNAGVTSIAEQHVRSRLLDAYPNPSLSSTTFRVESHSPRQDSWIIISDMQGKAVANLPLTFNNGTAEVRFNHGWMAPGTYTYSLMENNTLVSSKMLMILK